MTRGTRPYVSEESFDQNPSRPRTSTLECVVVTSLRAHSVVLVVPSHTRGVEGMSAQRTSRALQPIGELVQRTSRMWQPIGGRRIERLPNHSRRSRMSRRTLQCSALVSERWNSLVVEAEQKRHPIGSDPLRQDSRPDCGSPRGVSSRAGRSS